MISQAEHLLEKLTTNKSPLVVCNSISDIEQTLSGLSFLGSIECVEKQKNKDKVMTLECKSKYGYCVRIPSDKNKCNIRSICELPNGDILVADLGNTCVKLFDTQFTIVAHIDLPAVLNHVCSISPTEVAVTVEDNCNITYTVQFLRVNNSQIVKGRILTFNHRCFGIAHFNGSLFISSYTALYRYKLDGQLVKKIYEDTSTSLTVNMCAVSADGSRLYVTSNTYSKLLTLSMDGTVLSSLEDYELGRPKGVHVSETGKLLVCGHGTKSVVQVDGDGVMVTLASKRDCPYLPLSVYYSARTGRVIVGGQQDDNILVINTL